MIQVELVDENGTPSKLGSGEVGDKRGEIVRGDGDGDLVVGRVRSGVGDEGDGVAVAAPRVRGVSESEERRSEEVGGAGQPFTLAVSVGPEGKGGPKRYIYFLRCGTFTFQMFQRIRKNIIDNSCNNCTF